MLRCLIVLLAGFISAAGPISKFDQKAATDVFSSSRAIGDVERCLIDMEGWPAPTAYRQPDRPNQVTLMWFRPNGIAAGRIDLRADRNRTEVRSWLNAKQVRECAP